MSGPAPADLARARAILCGVVIDDTDHTLLHSLVDEVEQLRTIVALVGAWLDLGNSSLDPGESRGRRMGREQDAHHQMWEAVEAYRSKS